MREIKWCLIVAAVVYTAVANYKPFKETLGYKTVETCQQVSTVRKGDMLINPELRQPVLQAPRKEAEI